MSALAGSAAPVRVFYFANNVHFQQDKFPAAFLPATIMILLYEILTTNIWLNIQ